MFLITVIFLQEMFAFYISTSVSSLFVILYRRNIHNCEV